MQRIPIIRSLGGCGSTLVSRLLASLSNVVLLSETNPRSVYLFHGAMNPINQIKGWFPELLPIIEGIDEFELGHPAHFGDLINKLYKYLQEEGKQLVIRDYCYIDFIGYPFTEYSAGNSSFNNACRHIFNFDNVILVRHPANQLASLRTHYCMRNLNPQLFIDGYINFLNFFKKSFLLQYETIISDPNMSMDVLCYYLGLSWSNEAINKFASIDKITGNLERMHDTSISFPPFKDNALQIEKELQQCNEYNHLLEMAGYL